MASVARGATKGHAPPPKGSIQSSRSLHRKLAHHGDHSAPAQSCGQTLVDPSDERQAST